MNNLNWKRDNGESEKNRFREEVDGEEAHE